MDDDTGIITNPMFRMRLRPDGIVEMVWTSTAVMGVEDAIAATEGIARLTGGRRSPLLVDVQVGGQMDRATRIEFTRRDDIVSAVALIVGTPLSRMMGNFFINVSRPARPTRLFDDEASAVAWLQTFLG